MLHIALSNKLLIKFSATMLICLISNFGFADNRSQEISQEIGQMKSSVQASTQLPQGMNQSINHVQLSKQLKIGDIIFIRIDVLPFKKVAETTNSWTNHVGIVVDVSGPEIMVGESTFPFSKKTLLSKFVARSEGGRVEVLRLKSELTELQKNAIVTASEKRNGIFYDTGFNLHSRGQFCSRYVREVINEATGIQVGEVEKFTTLLSHNPQQDLTFWKFWYFGSIPWQRETVSPASLLISDQLQIQFAGIVRS